MTYQEFYKSLIFREKAIYIPKLNLSLSKIQFLGKEYNFKAQDEYLQKFYNDNLEELSKQKN